MKLLQVSAAPPRSSFSTAKVTRVPSALSGPCNGFRGPRRHSVCAFCRIFEPNKVAINSMILSAIGSCYVARFHTSYPKASGSLSSRQSYRDQNGRSFSTASLVVSPNTSNTVHSSFIVTGHLSPSDAPQRSDEWFALRKDKLTTSTFSTALGFWKGNRRFELWHEKVYDSGSEVIEASKRFAMDWGVLNEAAAIDRYKTITGREVSAMGFAIHANELFHWLGASPDGLLGCFPEGGILEVKCPYNKGKPDTALPWSTMPFYYMPQIQGQMEIMDREWVDLYCWTRNGSTIFRVNRERGYWDIIHGILREFWWENVIPAREALLVGKEEEAKSFKPTSTHRQTGLAIAKSIQLAGEAKLLSREIAGHVEFYR